MNSEPCCQKTSPCAYIVGLVGAFLLVLLLVHFMRHYTEAPPLAEIRAQERLKNLADFRAANAPLLEKYDWQDQSKGIVRIPIDRAKELVLEEWKNPEAARSNLMARAAKAFALPPKVPEKKNEYE